MLYWKDAGGLLELDGTRWSGADWVSAPDFPGGLPQSLISKGVPTLVGVQGNDQLLLIDANVGTLSTWSKGSWTTMVSRGQWVIASVVTAVAYDPSQHELVILSCCGDKGGTGTWVWNGKALVQFPALPHAFVDYEHGGGSFLVHMAPDGNGHLLAIGSDGSGGYSWDGASWSSLGRGGRLDEYSFDMAYDPAHQQLIAIGYYRGFHTYRWLRGAWSEVSTNSTPPAANISNIVYDPIASRLVLTDLR